MEKSHYEFDLPGAEKEFLTAIELNPNSASAHPFIPIAASLPSQWIPLFPSPISTFRGFWSPWEDRRNQSRRTRRASCWVVPVQRTRLRRRPGCCKPSRQEEKEDFCQKNLERTLQTIKQPGDESLDPAGVASAYAFAGKDSAFKWLDKAYAERDGQDIMLLKCVPSFKSHHGDPRFADLLRRLGRPE
jgi:hypothetical protein